MTDGLTAIGLEIVVEDIDRAIELFVDVLGCPLLGRGPASHVEGESATVDAGNIIISILQPAGEGFWLKPSQVAPRLSQIIFGAHRTELGRLAAETVASGLPVVEADGRFHIPPEAARGIFGSMTAVVVVDVGADEADGSSAAPVG